jgi:hypothetical protein
VPNYEKRFELIGWIGFVLIVSAYLLLTLKQLEPNSATYHSINLLGAICMVANAMYKQARPIFWLNVVWSLIALIGLLKLDI